MKPSEAAAEAMARHWGYRSIDTDWDAQCGVAWEEMQVVPDDGDPRSIGERLDALAELEARSAA